MSTGKLSLAFEERTVIIRGTTFRFREISGGDYDDILKLTIGPDGTAELGPVLKLMVIKSVVDPKLSGDDYSNLPLPVQRAVNDVVNEMHFSEPKNAEAVATNGASPAPNA